ncbi:hypothetical protein [uncultured Finegoldia sp.]|uniref:hypothetical protein n=1 Tax=uncultured Finegoldia sp. TaxID=328009 RepID=UPI00260B3387|nr:hypothetical protein [uncultured Finegoldia sp.]
MSEQEIYEITRNYAVVTAVFLLVNIFNFYITLKQKSNVILNVVVAIVQVALVFGMWNMNFTITLLHDGMGANDTMLVKFCLYGNIFALLLMGISAIITIRNILKQRKEQTK